MSKLIKESGFLLSISFVQKMREPLT